VGCELVRDPRRAAKTRRFERFWDVHVPQILDSRHLKKTSGSEGNVCSVILPEECIQRKF
jgi:hypothetical protein